MYETYKTFSDWYTDYSDNYARVVKEIERRFKENAIMNERYFSIDRENLCNYNWSGTKHDISIYDYIADNCKLRDAIELIIYVFDSEKRASKYRTVTDYASLHSIKESNVDTLIGHTAVYKKCKKINAYRINDGYYMIIGVARSEEEEYKERKTQWVNEYYEKLRQYCHGGVDKHAGISFKATAEQSGNRMIVAVAKQRLTDHDSNTDIKIGISRCSDKDIFDYDTGAAIAFARAIGDRIPDYVIKY